MNYELRIDRRMCFPTRDARPTASRANSLFSPGQHPGGGIYAWKPWVEAGGKHFA